MHRLFAKKNPIPVNILYLHILFGSLYAQPHTVNVGQSFKTNRVVARPIRGSARSCYRAKKKTLTRAHDFKRISHQIIIARVVCSYEHFIHYVKTMIIRDVPLYFV